MLSLCITPANQEIPGIHCDINTSAGKVGVSVVPERDRGSLSIRAIVEGGQVDQWNEDHPLQKIKIRDRVVEINGRRGTCLDLLKEMAQASGPLRMVVMRRMSF